MENTNNANCCTPNDNTLNKNKSVKNTFGLGILGLALILALTTAFKGSEKPLATSCSIENSGTPSKSDFKWIKTQKDVVYLLLKGNDVNQNEKLTLKVDGIVNELNETDGSAYFLVLEATNPHYQELVSKLKIEDIPSLVVLGKSASILKGEEINSAKLIRAYDAALTEKTSCSPAKKASCVGKSNASCDPKAVKASCTSKQKAACADSKKSN